MNSPNKNGEVVIHAILVGTAFLKNAYNSAVAELYGRLENAISSKIPSWILSDMMKNPLDLTQIERREFEKILDDSNLSEDTIKTAQNLINLVKDLGEGSIDEQERKIKQVYELQRRQARQWFLLAIISASLGFLLIIIGIAVAFLLTSSLTYGLTPIVVLILAGIIVNITSALFFRQAHNANKQVTNMLESINELQRLEITIKLLAFSKADDKSSSKS